MRKLISCLLIFTLISSYLPVMPAYAKEKKIKLAIYQVKAKNINEVFGKSLAKDLWMTASKTNLFELLTIDSLNDFVESLPKKMRKQLQCNTDSCLAEIALALDVDLIITGSIGQIGKVTVVNLRLFDAKEGKTVKNVGRGCDCDEIETRNMISQLGLELLEVEKKELATSDYPAERNTSLFPPGMETGDKPSWLSPAKEVGESESLFSPVEIPREDPRKQLSKYFTSTPKDAAKEEPPPEPDKEVTKKKPQAAPKEKATTKASSPTTTVKRKSPVRPRKKKKIQKKYLAKRQPRKTIKTRKRQKEIPEKETWYSFGSKKWFWWTVGTLVVVGGSAAAIANGKQQDEASEGSSSDEEPTPTEGNASFTW